jgi:hypothetical protein
MVALADECKLAFPPAYRRVFDRFSPAPPPLPGGMVGENGEGGRKPGGEASKDCRKVVEKPAPDRCLSAAAR